MTKSFCHADGDLTMEEVLTELVGVGEFALVSK